MIGDRKRGASVSTACAICSYTIAGTGLWPTWRATRKTNGGRLSWPLSKNPETPVKKPAEHNYDKTQARRQAKRRALFNQMRDALRAIEGARTLSEAKALARDGLDEKKFGETAN